MYTLYLLPLQSPIPLMPHPRPVRLQFPRFPQCLPESLFPLRRIRSKSRMPKPGTASKTSFFCFSFHILLCFIFYAYFSAAERSTLLPARQYSPTFHSATTRADPLPGVKLPQHTYAISHAVPAERFLRR